MCDKFEKKLLCMNDILNIVIKKFIANIEMMLIFDKIYNRLTFI